MRYFNFLLFLELFAFQLYAKSDRLRNHLLENVKVYQRKHGHYQTEKALRRFNSKLLLIDPSQLAISFDDVELSEKKILNIDICFTNKIINGDLFKVSFYSIGENKLPDKLIKSREMLFTSQKSGWANYPLALENIRVPRGGIAISIQFMSKFNFQSPAIARIGFGKYAR